MEDAEKIKAIPDGADTYLTEFVSDSRDEYWDFYKDPDAFKIHEGGHGYPRSEEDYDEIDDRIFLPKTKEELNED